MTMMICDAVEVLSRSRPEETMIVSLKGVSTSGSSASLSPS